MNDWILKLSEELLKPLPGTEAQFRMSPSVRRPVSVDRPRKKSGVLLLLYPHEGKVHTVLIRRTDYNGVHSGQVSLPGGMYRDSDGSLRETALREAMEETGLNKQEITVLGQLTPLHIPVSNIDVFPFVATAKQRPHFSPDPTEVSYLIETSLDELFNPANRKQMMMQLDGVEIEVPFFDIRDNHVWGATAMILSEFREIVRRIC